MPTTRPRRIVRRAVMAITAVVIAVIVWLTMREPPVVEPSRKIRLGMSRAEVESILGPPSIFTGPANGETLFWGRSGELMLLESRARESIGAHPAPLPSFPVVITFFDGRVGIISRDGEVEQ
jgi:hypothetical protein